jgi:GntR family transcriptional regulator, rspAB operon transcriptional repressor
VTDTGTAALSAVAALGPERTVEQVLARELRTAILEGHLPPGTRLRYRELAQRFGVSVTPVRIALRELAQEGLVAMRPHEGAHVTPLSRSELEEIYAARSGFEGWLARQGAERLTDADRDAMAGRLAAAEAAAAAHEREDYLAAVWDLRTTCYRVAGRPALLQRVAGLYARSARYNWLTLRDAARLEESLAGARAFDAACRDGDGRRARELVRDALDRTMEHLLGRFADEHGADAETFPDSPPASGSAGGRPQPPSGPPGPDATPPPNPPSRRR